MVVTRSQGDSDKETSAQEVDARRAAKKIVSAKRQAADDGRLQARDVDEYADKKKEITESTATARQKEQQLKKLKKNFTELLRRQSEPGYESTDDEVQTSVNELTHTLTGVYDHVQEVIDRRLNVVNGVQADSTLARCMKAAGTTTVPVPMDFSNLAVSLNPLFWPCVCENFVTAADLVDEFSERATGGKFKRAFERNVLEALTQRINGDAVTDPTSEEKDGVRAVANIAAQVAAHWVAGHEEDATAFINRWTPLLDEARRIVTERIFPNMLRRLVGADESRDFVARTLLDSSRIPSFLVSSVQSVLHRPRFGSKGPAAVTSSTGATAKKYKQVKFDENKHVLVEVNGVTVVEDKATKRRLGRPAP
jgi:hypothetical protein